MIKFKDYLNETTNDSDYIFHVTKTSDVNSILKRGIIVREESNYVNILGNDLRKEINKTK